MPAALDEPEHAAGHHGPEDPAHGRDAGPDRLPAVVARMVLEVSPGDQGKAVAVLFVSPAYGDVDSDTDRSERAESRYGDKGVYDTAVLAAAPNDLGHDHPNEADDTGDPPYS